MSRTSTCAEWEEQRLSSQDKEPKLRLSLETRVTEDVAVIRCKSRITYGIEAAALSGEVANAHVERSSGIPDLDTYALSGIQRTKYNRRPGCGPVHSEATALIHFER